jgi:hypothetical protein
MHISLRRILLRKAICRWALQAGFAALLFACVSQTAWSQNRRTNNNTAQAVLHIQATVVSVITTPSVHSDHNSSSMNDVVYNLPAGEQHFTVISEIRPLRATDDVATNRGMLKTTTIVSQ